MKEKMSDEVGVGCANKIEIKLKTYLTYLRSWNREDKYAFNNFELFRFSLGFQKGSF